MMKQIRLSEKEKDYKFNNEFVKNSSYNNS